MKMLCNISKIIHLFQIFTSPLPSFPLQLFGLTEANRLLTVQTDGTVERLQSSSIKRPSRDKDGGVAGSQTQNQSGNWQVPV